MSVSQNGTTSESDGWVRLEIQIDAETMREIEAAIEDNGWEYDEGLRLLLGSGLAYVKGERVLQAIESGILSKDELQRTLSRMMETETRLAVLRFRTFEAQQANQAWELSTGAIKNENQGLRAVVQRLREENAALRAENDRLRRLLPTLDAVAELDSPADTPTQSPPLDSTEARHPFWQVWRGLVHRNSGRNKKDG